MTKKAGIKITIKNSGVSNSEVVFARIFSNLCAGLCAREWQRIIFHKQSVQIGVSSVAPGVGYFGFYYCIPESEALNQSDNQPPALIRRNLGYAGTGSRFVSRRSLACVRLAVGRGDGYSGIQPGTFTASLGQFRPSSDVVQF
jgi:hypothetical protein